MGVAQGKKVSSDGVAAQTIEAQPVFGQIEPSKRPRASRAEPQVREKMAGLGLTWQEVETVRRKKRNEGRQKAISSAQGQSRTTGSGAASMCTARNQRHRIEVLGGRSRLSLAQVRGSACSAPIQPTCSTRRMVQDHF